MRNFGVRRRPASGDSPVGARSRVGEPREQKTDSGLCERAARGFVLLCVAFIAASVIIACLIFSLVPFGEVFSVG